MVDEAQREKYRAVMEQELRVLMGDIMEAFKDAPVSNWCNMLRADLQTTVDRLQMLKRHKFFHLPCVERANADLGEMQANLMLALRHCEDARMRLGKVMQAMEGGVSILDDSKRLLERAVELDGVGGPDLPKLHLPGAIPPEAQKPPKAVDRGPTEGVPAMEPRGPVGGGPFPPNQPE